MAHSLREGPVVWTRDLNGSTAVTVFPSLATDGVPIPSQTGRNGNRVHVGVDYTAASGTLSLTVALYGYTNPSTTWATSTWVYLGSLNGGTSIAADTAKWSVSATRICLAEVFSCSGENYTRFATRVGPPGGSSPVVSTYIGFPIE